jgi:hypothetical protein
VSPCRLPIYYLGQVYAVEPIDGLEDFHKVLMANHVLFDYDVVEGAGAAPPVPGHTDVAR